MKKITFLTLILVLSIAASTQASNESIPLRAEASSIYGSRYSADKALDGSRETYWVGARSAYPWAIEFDAGEVTNIDEIKAFWHHNTRSLPADYNVEVSNNGQIWAAVEGFTNLVGEHNPYGQIHQINHETRYVRLYINGVNDNRYYPILTEFQAYKEANVPHLIRFQGVLGDGTGLPLNQGETRTLTFKIYNTEIGGEHLWTEDQTVNELDGTLVDGLLDVELGSEEALNLDFDEQYYLGITVENDPDGEMTPRFKLTSVPYAFRSEE